MMQEPFWVTVLYYLLDNAELKYYKVLIFFSREIDSSLFFLLILSQGYFSIDF